MEGERFLSDTLCHEVLLANDVASSIAKDYCFDVLDLHHAMRRHIQWRLPDGLHWNERAHRKISAIILHHICTAWHVILPPRIDRNFNVLQPLSATSEADEPSGATGC